MRVGSVVLAHVEPDIPGLSYSPFSYGGRRLQAVLRADPAFCDVPVVLLESRSRDVEEWADRIAGHKPDVVGLSVYVWSFPTMLAVARALRSRLAHCHIVLGGPSARAEMLALAPFRDAVHDIDAVVLYDGEYAFRDILTALSRDRTLATVPGLLLPRTDRFVPSPAREPIENLDQLPSPLSLGLTPGRRTVPLETYRGCPMSCRFCQWGDGSTARTFSEAYLRDELGAIKALGPESVLLVDAGINLNSRAFRHLVDAERSVGVFQHSRLYGAVYPAHVNDYQLDFLAGIRRPLLDLGIQTFDTNALSEMGRAFKESRLPRILDDLVQVSDIDIELILGLPGDTPGSFRQTLHRALELPCRVLRVFHCLVLPDALMTKTPPSYRLQFDPVTLRLTSCTGWSPEELRGEIEHLEALVARRGGAVLEDQWEFVGPLSTARDEDTRGEAGGRDRDVEADDPQLLHAFIHALGKPWEKVGLHVSRAHLVPGGARLRLEHQEGANAVDVDLTRDGERPYFLEHDGVRLSYQASEVAPEFLRAVARAAPLLCRAYTRVCPRDPLRLPLVH